MPQGGQPYLSDDQLRELAADPRFTSADRELLSPGERHRLEQMTQSGGSSTMGQIAGFGRGAVKGLGETALGLGQAVHQIPGVSKLVDALYGQTSGQPSLSERAFPEMRKDVQAQGGAEELGKMAEGVGEFFIPASPAKLQAVKSLVKLIPNAASASQMKILNKVAQLLGRTGGEAGSAGAISALHGEPNPEGTAGIAGAGPLLGQAAESGVNSLGKAAATKVGRDVIPLLAAMAAMQVAGGFTPLGLGSAMGSFGLAKRGARGFLQDPRKMKLAKRALSKGAAAGTRAAAGAYDVSKRRLPEEE